MGRIIPWALTEAQQIYTAHVSAFPDLICFWLTSPHVPYPVKIPFDISSANFRIATRDSNIFLNYY